LSTTIVPAVHSRTGLSRSSSPAQPLGFRELIWKWKQKVYRPRKAQ
jgi:hypothetical protein